MIEIYSVLEAKVDLVANQVRYMIPNERCRKRERVLGRIQIYDGKKMITESYSYQPMHQIHEVTQYWKGYT